MSERCTFPEIAGVVEELPAKEIEALSERAYAYLYWLRAEYDNARDYMHYLATRVGELERGEKGPSL